MTITIFNTAALEPTEVTLQYMKRLPSHLQEKPYILGYDIPVNKQSDRTNVEFEDVNVLVYNLRPVDLRVRLEDCGFELAKVPENIMRMYFSNHDRHLDKVEGVRELLQQRFNAHEVIIFDHAYRKEEPQSDETKYSFENKPTHSLVVRNPHADQTPESGLRRIRHCLSSKERIAYAGKEWRFRIINFWMPIQNTVSTAPLLMCDPLTIHETDKSACDVVSQSYVGESVFLHHSPMHRWYWFSEQNTDEALLFVSFDSDPTNYIQFKAPTLRIHAPRQSMEVRAVIITRQND